MRVRVLDVGQCGIDRPRIAALCRRALGATVEHCATAEDAMKLASEAKYDLVLVNRVLDSDGSSGLDLIGELMKCGSAHAVMLVSNYVDAQQEAVALGAKRGFGKSALDSSETLKIVKRAVEQRPSESPGPGNAPLPAGKQELP